MIIYCSKKLETFLGQTSPIDKPTDISAYGDWNAQLFTIDRKKCIIFMNNRTCYSVVMSNVMKKNMKDIGLVFKEGLIRQLAHDMRLTEGQEIKIRNDLRNMVFTKTNNDKKIIGTINHHVENLKYGNYDGGVQNWDDIHVTGILNSFLVGTKILHEGQRRRDFFVPIELMETLIK